ncbi:MAG TPA: hypothetical protein PKJ99_02465 [Thermoanaerobaculales bacterium]|nr:hypothetical protein [Thermoanaerobaculales bacterium]
MYSLDVLLAALGLTAFAVVLAAMLIVFIRSENIRHNRERAEFEREHQAVMDAADRAIEASRRCRRTSQPP